MTKKEFITIMDQAIKYVSKDELNFSCWALSFSVKKFTKKGYCYNTPIRMVYSDLFECRTSTFCKKLRRSSDKEVKLVRMHALLLFKEKCLSDKSYERMKS